MAWSDKNLALWSRGRRLRLDLNPSAASVWLLCDGRSNVAGIKERLKLFYPTRADQIDQDVAEALADFHARHLIRIATPREGGRALIRVAFAGFWPGFLEDDNYFLWMLTHKFDVMLVDALHGDPNIVFHSTFWSGEKDTSLPAASRRALKFLFLPEADDSDPSEYDFVFHGGLLESDTEQGRAELPLWCLYVDWEAYEKSESSFSEEPSLARYKPRKVCQHLYDEVFREALEGEGATRGREKGPPPREARLTVGMATYDDYDGVYFSMQALRLYHPEVADQVEILIVDNHPDGLCASQLRQLAGSFERCRYVPYGEIQTTFVKDMVFREAASPCVLCMDSHVLLTPGALSRLMEYLDARPGCMDLLQGPLVYDDLQSVSTHFDPVWSGGMYGVWATDERGLDPDGEPFEIPMQGMGLFACRKEAWPGFNPRFQGFGGEEGYIHEKFRQKGRRTLCLPFLRWVHRFNRPFGIRYRNVWEDRIRNYYIGFRELGMETTEMEAHFREYLGTEIFDNARKASLAELESPFHDFDAIYCVNADPATHLWEAARERLGPLGILGRVRRFSSLETEELPDAGPILSHRAIIGKAKRQGLRNVLVLQDDLFFLEDVLPRLKKSLEELRNRKWGLLHLGGHRSRHEYPPSGASLVKGYGQPVQVCAVAYHRSSYERILDEVPEGPEEVRDWVFTHGSLHEYLRTFEDGYLVWPALCAPPAPDL